MAQSYETNLYRIGNPGHSKQQKFPASSRKIWKSAAANTVFSTHVAATRTK